eukprot:GEMP01012143.1.p1 GENE.GEMP01012143.1~~GEMP01012143.1.p1  ORF type:complete len:479 (+),score=69.10 GEMP01012143.1:237-1673(+)
MGRSLGATPFAFGTGGNRAETYEAVSDHSGVSDLVDLEKPGEPYAELLVTQRVPATFDIFCMTSFNFPYGAICSPMGIALLPLESTHLFPDNSPLALGCMMGIVGISQLICPIAGKISDGFRCKIGKRRPFVYLGSIMSILSLIFMWWASAYGRGYCFVAGLFVAMFFLNIAFSASGGLVPDLVPEEQQGKSSGMVGLHLLSGAVSGFLFLIGTYNIDYRYNYAFYMVLLTLACFLMCWKANELSTASLPPVKYTIEDFLRCFVLDTSQGYDFAWVFAGRTLYYIGVSCQTFFLFYVRDMIHLDDESSQKIIVGAMGLLGQFCGALVTYPAGKLSDGPCGRKNLVYFACLIMCLVYISFIFVPLLKPPYDLVMLFFLMMVYGFGNGAFLSVDYALALDCIPDRSKTAQALGMWGVSAFLGLAIGPIFWGAALETFRELSTEALPPDAYPQAGYTTLLVGGCIMVFAAGRCIHYVKSAR